MSRQAGYRQVSLTIEAHKALQRMSYGMSAAVAERVTLSQTVLIAERIYGQSDADGIVEDCARQVGIEPATDAS